MLFYVIITFNFLLDFTFSLLFSFICFLFLSDLVGYTCRKSREPSREETVQWCIALSSSIHFQFYWVLLA